MLIFWNEFFRKIGMKKLKPALLLLSFFFSCISGNTQSWIRIFNQGTHNTWFHDMVEAYDKGYLIAGQVVAGEKVLVR